MIELKPCPFCGGKAVWEEDSDIFGDLVLTAYKIKCSKCWCSPFPNNYNGDKKKLAEIWNTRTPQNDEVRE